LESVTTTAHVSLRAVTRRLDLYSLRLLDLVCREGSYSMVSRIEPLSSSAIAKRVGELERLHGISLLVKEGPALAPTDAAVVLLERWQAISLQLEPLVMLHAGGTALATASIEPVEADPAAARLLKALAATPGSHQPSALRLKVASTRMERLHAALGSPRTVLALWALEGEALALRLLPLPAQLGFRQHELRVPRHVVVMRRQHRWAGQAALTPDLLGPHCCTGLAQREAALQRQGPQALDGVLRRVLLAPPAAALVLPALVNTRLHRFEGLCSVPICAPWSTQPFACAVRDDERHSDRLALLRQAIGAV
jgi:DNA-binding transcriptional LysR family regulator